MKGQKSVPPTKNIQSLRVGSLHANKEGRLFKVVRLASNKKVWRVGRAKPKPQPKKTKSNTHPNRRTLKGGDQFEIRQIKHENEYHHMLRHWFCQIARMNTKANNKVCLQFFQTFKALYGAQDCFAGQEPFNKNLMLKFVNYLKDKVQLDETYGCSKCLGLLRSKEFAKYIQQLNDKDVHKALVVAKTQTKRLRDPDSEEYVEMEFNSSNQIFDPSI
jgi:hypothetical protein